MAQVFGQPASPATASSILGNATLNATPSPAVPQTVPSDSLKVQYERLLWAAYQVRKVETDKFRLTDLEQCISFAERICQELGLGQDETVVPAPPGVLPKPPSTSVAPAMGLPRVPAGGTPPLGAAPAPPPQGVPSGLPGAQ